MKLKKLPLCHDMTDFPLHTSNLVGTGELLGIGGYLKVILDFSHCSNDLIVHLLCIIKLVSTAIDFIDDLAMKLDEA